MSEFNFYIQKKYIVWEEEYHTVESETEEEAIELIKNHIKDEYNAPDSFVESEIIFETMEFITPKENGGGSTIEIYDEDRELVDWNGD